MDIFIMIFGHYTEVLHFKQHSTSQRCHACCSKFWIRCKDQDEQPLMTVNSCTSTVFQGRNYKHLPCYFNHWVQVKRSEPWCRHHCVYSLLSVNGTGNTDFRRTKANISILLALLL